MKPYLLGALTLLLAMAVAVGCASPSQGSTRGGDNERATGAPAETILVASFNIQVFGKAKRGKPEVMETLVEIVEDYDFVAVQEFRDATETTPQVFLDQLNAGTRTYGMEVSPRLGRTSSKEQYAFYYDADSVTVLDQGYVYADPGDVFEREPHIVQFKTGEFSFVAINIHTKPDDATAEIAALVDVVADAQARYPDEDDFIVLGDFNADGRYYDEDDDTLPLRAPAYRWVIPNSADTTVAASNNTYDRIVFLEDATDEDFEGTWGVHRFDTEASFTGRGIEAKAVSDHYPVWGKFFKTMDTN